MKFLTVGESVKDDKDNVYILDEIIGQGGFGCVFKSHRESDNINFAIKTLIPSFADSSCVQSFKNEIKLALKVTGKPIISHADFNRVQEEMARRSAKRSIADKLTKTEQGKYSAKYALSELLICGECGSHYRRVTWTAKGFKEIKWRCISRIQYGKKKCHSSPTVDEQPLHKAIVSAINEFCEVKDDVAKALRESINLFQLWLAPEF